MTPRVQRLRKQSLETEPYLSVERAALMSEGPRLRPEDLALPLAKPGTGPGGWRPELPEGGVALRDVERGLVLEALQRSAWVQKDAAALLGISRRKLNYMIQRMGLTHPSWRRNRDGTGDSIG